MVGGGTAFPARRTRTPRSAAHNRADRPLRPLDAGDRLPMKAGQYAIFGGLFFGTAGRWRLVATVPQLPVRKRSRRSPSSPLPRWPFGLGSATLAIVRWAARLWANRSNRPVVERVERSTDQGHENMSHTIYFASPVPTTRTGRRPIRCTPTRRRRGARRWAAGTTAARSPGFVDASLRQAINDYSEMIAQPGELVFAKDDKIRILPSEFTPNLDHPAFDAVGTPLWTTAEGDAYGDSVARGYVRLDYLSTGPPREAGGDDQPREGRRHLQPREYIRRGVDAQGARRARWARTSGSTPCRVEQAAAATMVFRPPLRRGTRARRSRRRRTAATPPRSTSRRST